MLTPPDKDFTYPKSLQKKLSDYETNFPVEKYKKQYPNINWKEFKKEALDHEKKRLKAVLKIMKIFKNWNFFVVNFNILDDVQHFCWHFIDKNHPQYDPKLVKTYGDIIRDFYEYLDKIVSIIIKAVNKDTSIIVISDHGFGSKFKESTLIGRLKRLISIMFGITKYNHITGDHKLYGIFIASGPEIKSNCNIEAEIIDLAPTILHMFGLKDKNMDGKVLNIFRTFIL